MSTTKKKNKTSQWDLMTFAFCGPREAFDKKLEFLAKLASPEPWETPNAQHPKDILFYYITKQFSRCYQQNLLVFSPNGDYCVSNTGLMTPRAEDIYMLFQKNRYYGKTSQKGGLITEKWAHVGFFKRSERDITSLGLPSDPQLPSFWEDESEAFFDTNAKISVSIDHIIDDHWDREEGIFPPYLKSLGKEIVTSLFNAALETSQKKAKRNMFLVVPQFYDGKYMFLMPLTLAGPCGAEPTTIALALQKQGDQYRGNTIFNLETAYKKARLINRPESNWLRISGLEVC